MKKDQKKNESESAPKTRAKRRTIDERIADLQRLKATKNARDEIKADFGVVRGAMTRGDIPGARAHLREIDAKLAKLVSH